MTSIYSSSKNQQPRRDDDRRVWIARRYVSLFGTSTAHKIISLNVHGCSRSLDERRPRNLPSCIAGGMGSDVFCFPLTPLTHNRFSS